jgi:hypothetical protein
MRWHQVFRTKTPKKWMIKPNQHQKNSKMNKIAKFGMKMLHISGCKAFSIQNIYESKNM